MTDENPIADATELLGTVTTREFQALLGLSGVGGGPVSGAEVCEIVAGVNHRAAVYTGLRGLESKGLVTVDEEHGRNENHYSLTPRGRRELRVLRSGVSAAVGETEDTGLDALFGGEQGGEA